MTTINLFLIIIIVLFLISALTEKNDFHFCFFLSSELSTLEGRNVDYMAMEIPQVRSPNVKAIPLYKLDGGSRKKNDLFYSLKTVSNPHIFLLPSNLERQFMA